MSSAKILHLINDNLGHVEEEPSEDSERVSTREEMKRKRNKLEFPSKFSKIPLTKDRLLVNQK